MSFLMARKGAGLSQAQAAMQIGVDQSTVCLWETGKTSPRVALLAKISKIYGCPIEVLLSVERKESK